uniref:Sucrose phosphatase-like domain-containing protein n=1 Tax=Oryza meridionalis TaxID=40149 RepID=A0A0E0ERW8_9ORYZ
MKQYDDILSSYCFICYNGKMQKFVSSYCFICYNGKMQKFVFLETPTAISSVLRPHWARRVNGKAHVILIQAQSDVLEVVPLGTSKGNGVKILLESLCASPDEVMALGDGENDKEKLLVDLLVSRSPTAMR